MKRVLAINPGATSTKYAVFEDEKVILKKTIEHQGSELHQFECVFDQYHYRLNLITEGLAKANISLNCLDGVVGRGGLLKPLMGGTYAVNDVMVEDLREAKQGEHASNLGAVMAYDLAQQLGIPAFIVDPVSVDEMEPEARLSGLPELPRVSMSHALNSKAVARKVAREMGKNYDELNFVVAHLGSGISISAHSNGRMVDVNNAKEEGPFSPDRCGGLPSTTLTKLCFSGKYTYNELRTKVMGLGGMYAYLGTKDVREVEQRSLQGDQEAELVLEAMAYQVAKEIGAMSVVLSGHVDKIILTGGIAYSQSVVDRLVRRVKFIAPVVVVPGEEELEALAQGAIRVLQGEEHSRTYQ